MKKTIKITVIAMMGMCLGVNAQEKIITENGLKSDFVYKNGNIGIGTSNPSTKLEVRNGALKVSGTSSLGQESSRFVVDTGASYAHSLMELRNINGTMFKVQGSGNIGLGTTSPSTKLEVRNGTLKVSGTSSLGQESSRFVVDTGASYAHSLMELRNINGVMFKVQGNGNASLNGKLEAREIKVTNTPTADFVFEEDYNLPTLKSIEKHIKEKKHLPEIASAKEMEKSGVNVGDFQIQLLQKIEELTLYTIEQEKSLTSQKREIEELKKQQNKIKRLESLVDKLLKDKK